MQTMNDTKKEKICFWKNGDWCFPEDLTVSPAGVTALQDYYIMYVNRNLTINDINEKVKENINHAV